VRCFVSVDIEDKGILDGLEEAQRRLASTGADLKCVERKNIHVTLRFLGDVREGLVSELRRLVSDAEFEPFQAVLKGLGVFPNIRRPRVVWAGIHEGAEELSRIFGHLEDPLGGLGFRPERRGFSPHVTLARVRSGRNRERLMEEVARSSDEFFGEMQVRHIRLKRSELTPRGPIYSTLDESRR